jgi:hypothetical protein
MTPKSHRSRVLVCSLAVIVALGAAACSKDDDSSTTTTSTTTTTEATSNATTVRFDKTVQADLKTVGCYAGADDGILGPETDAAILAFQRAAGLTPDGELGPETSKALEDDASSGKKVCDATTTTTTGAPTTTTPSGGTAPCTATALAKGLPAEGEKITSYVCADGWAAGSVSGGTKFVLQSQKGQWYAPSQDPCDSASAGLPPVILQDGCGS